MDNFVKLTDVGFGDELNVVLCRWTNVPKGNEYFILGARVKTRLSTGSTPITYRYAPPTQCQSHCGLWNKLYRIYITESCPTGNEVVVFQQSNEIVFET